MKSPSFAFNSCDVPGPNYRMWRWMEGYRGFSALALVYTILETDDQARKLKGERLLNIVINSHGAGGYVSIAGQGNLGLNKDSACEFLRLRGRNLGTIWLVSCQAAQGDYGSEFCQILARNSGCQVIATDEFQEVGPWGTFRLATSAKFDHIDEFEGNIYAFTPNGGKRRVFDPHNDPRILTITDWQGRI
jgi:hypothetical protein